MGGGMVGDSMVTKDQYPAFGHAMRKEFLIADDFVPLNHGSYGAYPKAVRDGLREYQDLIESNCDLWMKKTMFGKMVELRKTMADFINADPEEVVMVQNTSVGVNSILRSLSFQPGDKILYFNTVYEPLYSALVYLRDTRPNLDLVRVNLAYPLSDDDYVRLIEEAIQQHSTQQHPIRYCFLDAVTSVPGVKVPIERILPLLRQHDILSIVDGAHAIGQIPLDMKALDPDFFVTNCHKWLYSVRGSAILYVPKRHHAIVHPTTISHGYKKGLAAEFEWVGTLDYSNYMSIFSALEYRKKIGGEERIQTYCHDLAIRGAQYLSKLFGTRYIENEEGTLTASMCNVQLPLTVSTEDDVLFNKGLQYMVDTLLLEFKCFASPYRHAGHWWIRCCVQVYNELEDFEKLGKALQIICARLEKVKGHVEQL
ncbi:hypothetical protein BZG36_03374 [Bifiguratus adelaidae]|uniref:Aminotransferase class V domain-containing protein n=1 Tax=Bifiguratus adelaidae TaxID=1938954 RepID=A0A261XXL5_9FUNG|nr:hypothetical protein BZG36_03374 [Bifiguratus adelaidae]